MTVNPYGQQCTSNVGNIRVRCIHGIDLGDKMAFFELNCSAKNIELLKVGNLQNPATLPIPDFKRNSTLKNYFKDADEVIDYIDAYCKYTSTSSPKTMTNQDDKKTEVQGLAESGTDQERLRATNEKAGNLLRFQNSFEILLWPSTRTITTVL